MINDRYAIAIHPPASLARMTPPDSLSAYRIWGRIEHTGPNEFAVIISAVPENGDPSLVRVLDQMATSRMEAEECAARLLKKMGQIVRDSEGRVTDIETDGF